MRKLTSFAVLWLALWVKPASADMIIASAAHPDTCTPQVVGYGGSPPQNTDALVPFGASGAIRLAGMDDGDTLYVAPGSYDQQLLTADWTDESLDNVVIIGSFNLTSEIRYTGASHPLVQCPDSSLTGNRIVNMRFERTTAGRGVDVRSAKNFGFYGCKFEGAITNLFLHGAGVDTPRAIMFTVDACSLGAVGTVATQPVYFTDSATTSNPWSVEGLYFRNNTIDMSAMTVSTTGFGWFNLYAVRRVEITGNTVTFGTCSGNGIYYGIHFRSAFDPAAGGGPASYWSQCDSILIADNTFIKGDDANAGASFAWEDMGIGAPQNNRDSSNIHNIRILRNTFIGPTSTTGDPVDYNGFKVESLFNSVNPDSTQHGITNVVAAFNVFTGIRRLAIGWQDGARHCKAIQNYAITADTSVTNTYAAWVFGGGRHCEYVDNYSEGFYSGVGLDAGGNTVTHKNYNNRATGNTITRAPRAYYFDARSAFRPDSLFVSMGNKSFAVNSWVEVDSTASDYHKGLTWWRGYKVPPGITGRNGPFSFGDMDYSEDPSALRVARALPYGMFHVLGNSGIGIQP